MLGGARIPASKTVIERGLGDAGIEAAQCIVCTQFDDDRVGPVRNRPIESDKPARSGVTRHTCVRDRGDNAFGFQGRGQLGWKSLFQRQTEPCAERVAEHDNVERPFSRLHARDWRKRAEQCEQRPRKTLDPEGVRPI
jgi:hypothetical protein